jgi:hypothetical protein
MGLPKLGKFEIADRVLWIVLSEKPLFRVFNEKLQARDTYLVRAPMKGRESPR